MSLGKCPDVWQPPSCVAHCRCDGHTAPAHVRGVWAKPGASPRALECEPCHRFLADSPCVDRGLEAAGLSLLPGLEGWERELQEQRVGLRTGRRLGMGCWHRRAVRGGSGTAWEWGDREGLGDVGRDEVRWVVVTLEAVTLSCDFLVRRFSVAPGIKKAFRTSEDLWLLEIAFC